MVEVGLWGLLASAFLAGSILPFASEAVLSSVILMGSSATSAVTVATIGNVLGAMTVYGIGRGAAGGDRNRLQRWLETRMSASDTELEAGRRRFARWGPAVLLFAWLPVIGDVLVLAAGVGRLRVATVLFFVTLGKAARYAVVAGAISGLR